MKTKTFTPLEIFLILMFVVLFLSGASKKFYLSEYQEECYKYEPIIKTYNWTDWRYEPSGCELLWCVICKCDLITEVHQFNLTTDSQKCIKYHLVRLSDG